MNLDADIRSGLEEARAAVFAMPSLADRVVRRILEERSLVRRGAGRRPRWLALGAAAACCLVAVGLGFLWLFGSFLKTSPLPGVAQPEAPAGPAKSTSLAGAARPETLAPGGPAPGPSRESQRGGLTLHDGSQRSTVARAHGPARPADSAGPQDSFLGSKVGSRQPKPELEHSPSPLPSEPSGPSKGLSAEQHQAVQLPSLPSKPSLPSEPPPVKSVCMKAKGTPAPNYELTVAAVADTTPREYVFVVGNVAFKSLDSLKKFVAGLPPGAALRWAPGCCRTGDEPLLSSPKDMEDFKTFCKEKKVQFVLVPSG